MELTLRGHEDRYAVEQLMLALFPESGGQPSPHCPGARPGSPLVPLSH